MYLIPLNQIESVDLVIHALRSAAGQADCTDCPVRKVCTQQCLDIAEGIQRLVETNSLPHMKTEGQTCKRNSTEEEKTDSGAHLRIIK